jgi:hypothetical protein
MKGQIMADPSERRTSTLPSSKDLVEGGDVIRVGTFRCQGGRFGLEHEAGLTEIARCCSATKVLTLQRISSLDSTWPDNERAKPGRDLDVASSSEGPENLADHRPAHTKGLGEPAFGWETRARAEAPVADCVLQLRHYVLSRLPDRDSTSETCHTKILPSALPSRQALDERTFLTPVAGFDLSGLSRIDVRPTAFSMDR